MSANGRAPTSTGGLPARLGRHRLLSPLGAGATGRVVLAETLEPGPAGPAGSRVALKVLNEEAGLDPILLERFAREARVASSLMHPGLVRVFDRGRERFEGRTWHYLVLEHVEGRQLSELLGEWGPLPEPLLRDLGAQLAEAVAALHGAGVVHRDVKPSNVLVTEEQRLKLLDFGVAHVGEALVPLTATGEFVGSPAWAAPEQFSSGPLGPAADLYSIGAVLLEAAAGSNPFLAGSPSQTMHRHLALPAPRLAELRPGCSTFLDELIAGLLSKTPENRPASARAVAEALRRGEDSEWWLERVTAGRAGRGRLGALGVAAGVPTVGRDEWNQRAERRLDEVGEGRGGLLLLTGEAGLGKSTLVAEWAGRASERGWEVLVGRATPGPRGRGAGPLLDALRSRLDEKRVAAVLEEAGVGDELSRARHARLVAGSGGAADAGLDRWLLATGNAALLRALARERCVICVLEDLHLVPAEDVEDLAALASGLAGQPIWIVATSRPASVLRPLDDAPPGSLESWELDALSEESLGRLLRIAGHEELTASELAGLVRRAEGNPFFALELARHQARAEGVERTGGLPGSVQRLLATRVRELPEEHRALLDAACVQGVEFDPGLLAACLDRPALGVLQQLVGIERAHGLVRAQGEGFRFDHHLVHEAVHSDLPASLEKALHGRVAEVLLRRWGVGEEPEDLAGLEGQRAVLATEHLARAGRPAVAAVAAVNALQELLGRHRSGDARALGELVLSALEPGPEHAELAVLQAEAHRDCGDAAAHRSAAEAAVRAAERGGSRRLQVRAALALYAAHRSAGEPRAALDALDAAWEREGPARLDPWERASLLKSRGYALRALSRGEEAPPLFREAFREARASGDERLIGRCLRALGDGAFSASRLVQARRLLSFHERHVPAERDPRASVNARWLLTLLCLHAGDEEEALAHAAAARAGVELGAPPVIRVMAMETELIASLGAGRLSRALAASERALRELKDGSTLAQRATALLNQAAARLQLGDHETAHRRLEEGLELARRLGARPLVAGSLAMQLDIEGAGPDPPAWSAAREEAAQFVADTKAPELRAPLLTALGRPALATGFQPTAQQLCWLHEAREIVRRQGLGAPGVVPEAWLALAGELEPERVTVPRRGLRPVLAEAHLVLALAGAGGDHLEAGARLAEETAAGLAPEEERTWRAQSLLARLARAAREDGRATR